MNKDLNVPNSITLVKKKRIIKAAKATAGSAINVLLASKVSLFTTNHHIGQGRLNTVMSKILGSIHVRLASPSDTVKTILHICCHCMDTAIAFTIL